MKVEAITLREIQMPLVQFFETSFKRTFSRRILLLTVALRRHSRLGRMRRGRRPVLQQRVDGKRLGHNQTLPGSGCFGENPGDSAGKRSANGEVARAQYGQRHRSKMRCGTRKRNRSKCLFGSCSAALCAKFPAVFPLAFRIPSSNCWRRFRSNLPLDIAASR